MKRYQAIGYSLLVLGNAIIPLCSVSAEEIPKTNETEPIQETISSETTIDCVTFPPVIAPFFYPKPAENPPETADTSVSEDNPSSTTAEIEETTGTTEKPENKDKESLFELPNPTPEQISHYQTLAQGDRLYQCDETIQAEQFYREAKTPFEAELNPERQLIPEPIYEPSQLLRAAKVYWRLYQESLERDHLKSKRLTSLKLLTEQYPEFIPAHLLYANALNDAGQPEKALESLKRATSLYPNEDSLVEAEIIALESQENWLEASLTARQFALLNPDHFRAIDFQNYAEINLNRYQKALKSQLTGNAVVNAILGGVGYALTGSLFGPLSTLETSILLLQGESAIGDRYVNAIQRRVPLVDDPQVLAYVREIGENLASVAGRDEFDYEFYVIMDEDLNAFALPGGKIFINAGAIAKTHSEAELAGLLAHELAHSVLSHGFQQMTKGALTFNITQYIPYVGGTAGNLLVSSYSREMERQADVFGSQLLDSSGYAADGVRNLMVILEQEANPSPPAWLSTHPATSERVRYLEEMIVKNQLNRYRYEGVVSHHTMRERVTELLQEYQAEEQKEE